MGREEGGGFRMGIYLWQIHFDIWQKQYNIVKLNKIKLKKKKKKKKRICLQCKRLEFDPCIRTIPWRREWLPTPLFFSGEFHGQRGLVGYGPWGRKELGTTERLTLTSQNFSYTSYEIMA